MLFIDRNGNPTPLTIVLGMLLNVFIGIISYVGAFFILAIILWTPFGFLGWSANNLEDMSFWTWIGLIIFSIIATALVATLLLSKRND